MPEPGILAGPTAVRVDLVVVVRGRLRGTWAFVVGGAWVVTKEAVTSKRFILVSLLPILENLFAIFGELLRTEIKKEELRKGFLFLLSSKNKFLLKVLKKIFYKSWGLTKNS